MLFEQKSLIKTGNITKEDVPLEEIPKVLAFFEEVLIELTTARKHEDAITQRLVQLALAKQHPLLRWIIIKDNENSDGLQEDIAISSCNTPHNEFFVFEAKRLDSTLPKAREKEYVVGKFDKSKNRYVDSGGIERFKKEKHGQKFIYAGMIGYVQTETFKDWEMKINGFIDEEIKIPSSQKLIWYNQDKLEEIGQNFKLAKYTSTHQCISGKTLYLTHLWINLI